jgi:glycosyltransferase involved in cell wall biosynthesis
MTGLTWSLVIATLNREDCLLRSLRANITQQRPPRQVIVIDSSDDWQRVRARVLDELGAATPGIEWIYLPSDERSLTHQRNLGFVHCTSDVAFFLDDDSFMYPDCAAEIMRVYEADGAAALGGVCAALAPVPPGSATADGAGDARARTLLDQALPWLKNQISRLWYQEHLFLPYDGSFHRRRIDQIPSDVGVPVALFHGCRMTFWSSAVRAAGGFQEMLVRGAFGEDADFSYRVSRQRALVMATRARLYHEQTPAQRAKVPLNACLVLLNAIALYRLNADASRADVARLSGFLAKRVMLELVRDCARGARGLPNTRGVLRAVRHLPEVLRIPRAELPQAYADLQRRQFARG